MKSQMSPQDVVREFCHSWFKNCEVEKATSLLAEDVAFIGINATESAQGKAALAQYISQYLSLIHISLAWAGISPAPGDIPGNLPPWRNVGDISRQIAL